MAQLEARKYESNPYIGTGITAYDATGAAISSFAGYTAGFIAKNALTDDDDDALIDETVTITNNSTGAYYFNLSVADLADIADYSVLHYELFIRPSSGDKITCETGTLTVVPTAGME